MKFCALFFFLFCFSAHAELQIPGKNLGQKTILFSWKAINYFMYGCTWDSKCGATAEEKALLNKILLTREKEPDPVFYLESEHPTLFDPSPDSTHRLAVTGNEVGSKIIFNAEQVEKGISFETAIAVLVHELGHHQGVLDTPERPLDVLGAKVAEYTRAHSETINFASHHQKHVVVKTFHGLTSISQFAAETAAAMKELSSLVVVTDGTSLYDFSDVLRLNLLCPLRAPILEGYLLRNTREENRVLHGSGPESVGLTVAGNLEVLCTASGTWPLVRSVLPCSFRLGVDLTPKTATTESDWWLKAPGLIPGPQALRGAMVDYKVASFADFIELDLAQDLKVLEVQYATTSLKPSSEWKVKARVQVSHLRKFSTCGGSFTSETFANLFEHAPRSVAFQSCKLTPLNDTTAELDLTYTFPEKTPSRTYYAKTFSLSQDSSVNPILGHAPVRKTIRLENPVPSTAPGVEGIRVLAARNKKLVVDQAIGKEPTNLNLQPGDTLEVAWKISKGLSLDRKSFLSAHMEFRWPGSEALRSQLYTISFDQPFFPLPWKDRTDVEMEGENQVFRFTLNIPKLEDPIGAYALRWIQTRYFFGFDSDLNEFLVPVPMTIQVKESL